MTKNSNKVKRNNSKANNFKLLADNRYAKFQYEISETIEAGIEITLIGINNSNFH